MECCESLLLVVWRAACLHRELEPSLAKIAPDLFARVPVAQVLIRRFDVAGHFVETAAAIECRGTQPIVEGRVDLSAEELATVIQWAGKHELAHQPARGIPPRGLFPVFLVGQAVAGPLSGESGPIGAAVFVATDDSPLEAAHEQFLRRLLEPLGAWLENDLQQRELAALRNSAGVERPGTLLASGEFAPLDVAMAQHIETALRRTHGRIEGPFGAARLLKINPHTLRGRMRNLGIDWRRFRAR